MSFIKILIYLPLVVLGYITLKVVFPPLNFPRNIPTIPFYTIFLPIFLDIDQIQLYELYLREPLEKYGAVKLFFGSRWNILVSKPEYLAQVFKDENTFAKSGNQKKIPYSVIAAYTGDNIISAHGVVWKRYRGIMTTGLQQFNEKPFEINAKLFCKLIQDEIFKQRTKKGNEIIMGPLIQRLALDNISQVLLGFDFGTLTHEHVPLHEHLIRIKKKIFHPFFLTFPFFDLLRLPQRRKGFIDVQKFREVLVSRVQDQMIENYKFEQTNFVSSDLIRAYNNKIIDYKQLTDNIVILLVAGHENPQVLLTTCFYMLAKYKSTWQEDIWNEIRYVNDPEKLPTLPVLNSFILESIRFFPPLNTIINRCTTRTCRIGEAIIIPKNTYVGYNNYSTTHDRKSWGTTADIFDPKRWGEDIDTIWKNWRHYKNNSMLSSFHGGKRACLGEKLALTEIRVTIFELLKNYKLMLAPSWVEKVTPAGPLCPANLKLCFEERCYSSKKTIAFEEKQNLI